MFPPGASAVRTAYRHVDTDKHVAATQGNGGLSLPAPFLPEMLPQVVSFTSPAARKRKRLPESEWLNRSSRRCF